ncbi:MAG: aminoglycoside phosphotransferase family protein [Polyangiaceae bacterium]
MVRTTDPFERIRRAIAARLPDYSVHSTVKLGEGLDNQAYEINGELVVRLSNVIPDSLRAETVKREADLLAAVGSISTLPVPKPVFMSPEEGCLAYFKLPGVSLLELARQHQSTWEPSVARALGGFLTALHGTSIETVVAFANREHVELVEWRAEAADCYSRVCAEIPAPYRLAHEAFLASPVAEPSYTAVFSHNDLGIEHVLVDPVTREVTGIIDWSDAAIVDPANDFGLLLRDLGPAALDLALCGYRGHTNDIAALRERAQFYARCKVLEDLAYGLESGRSLYVDKSIATMSWLFLSA